MPQMGQLPGSIAHDLRVHRADVLRLRVGAADFCWLQGHPALWGKSPDRSAGPPGASGRCRCADPPPAWRPAVVGAVAAGCSIAGPHISRDRGETCRDSRRCKSKRSGLRAEYELFARSGSTVIPQTGSIAMIYLGRKIESASRIRDAAGDKH